MTHPRTAGLTGLLPPVTGRTGSPVAHSQFREEEDWEGLSVELKNRE